MEYKDHGPVAYTENQTSSLFLEDPDTLARLAEVALDEGQSREFLERWRKSSFSDGGDGNCVEVAFGIDAVGVRDLKNPDGPRLEFPRDTWLLAVGRG